MRLSLHSKHNPGTQPRSSEIILTIGHSKTVEAFLKSAGHYRNYTVIVAETGPSYVIDLSLVVTEFKFAHWHRNLALANAADARGDAHLEESGKHREWAKQATNTEDKEKHKERANHHLQRALSEYSGAQEFRALDASGITHGPA